MKIRITFYLIGALILPLTWKKYQEHDQFHVTHYDLNIKQNSRISMFSTMPTKMTTHTFTFHDSISPAAQWLSNSWVHFRFLQNKKKSYIRSWIAPNSAHAHSQPSHMDHPRQKFRK